MGSLQFHPLFPWPVMLIAALVILIFLLVLEFKQRSKYQVVNVVLQIVVVLALLALASRPYMEKEIDTESIILLSHNFDKAVTDSLSNTLSNPQFFHLEGVNSFKKSSLLESLESLQGMNVYVVGDGIPYYALEKIRANKFQYFPAENYDGVQSLLPQDPFTVYRMGMIKGVINNSGTTATLYLKGPEGDLDSVQHSKSGINSFALKFRPKVVGDFVYQLEQRDSLGDILFSEPIPVSVLPERKLNILLLQNFPSVELRFLKNYLGEKGHSIAIRYGVSKNIDRSEFVNRASESLARISSSLLAQFDLVVISTNAYDNLPQSTQRILEQSIKDGLGLVFLMDNDPKKSAKQLLQLEFTKIDQDTVQVNLGADGDFTFPIAATRVNPNDLLIPVLSNRNNTVEGYVSNRNGKVGFQLLQEVYSLILSGKVDAYAQFWSPLLEDVARKKKKDNQLKITTPFPWYEDEPLEVQLISSNSNPMLEIDGIQIPLVEDTRIDGIWTTTVWPTHAGWNRLAVEGDSTKLDFYVSGKDEWSSLRTVNQIKENKLYAVSANSDTMDPKIREEEISPLLFFIIFLLASGVLWLLPKV